MIFPSHFSLMLRLAIIGSGFGQYGLLPAFRSIRNCTVIALCGRKRPQLLDYCKRIGFTNLYDDWRTMLKNEKPDAVAIAVTPDAQYRIAKEAIGKGLHVFAEKPLAATLRQAKQLLALAKKKKITHAVDFLFPEIAEWKKAKELIDAKTFGKLKHISVNWDFLSYDIGNKQSSWKTDSKEGGGALSFYFSHGLHYLEYFAGKITEMKGSFSYDRESLNGAETGVDLQVKFTGGIDGTAHVQCNNHKLTRHRLVFQCERGTIMLENRRGIVDHFLLTIRSPKGNRRLKVKRDRGEKGEGERVKIVRKIAERFVKSCLAKKQMSPSLREGVRVQELIEMARKRE